jgi:hypothetical protein
LQQPATADLVALFKDGCKLSLCSVVQQAATAQSHLIAEFEHEGFAELEACDCHVLPGPLVLLQPEPGQLLVLLRASPAAAASAATVQAGGWDDVEAPSMAEPAWQLLQLSLPVETVIQAAVQHCPHLQLGPLAYGLHSSRGATGAGCLTAAGPWQLLHANSMQQGMLQLLLAVPVAGPGPQQEAVLLCQLLVNTFQDVGTAADQVNRGMKVTWCQLLDWPATPSCAAVWGPSNHPVFTASSTSQHHLAAVGSHAGDLLVLDLQDASSSSDAAAACCLEQHQQQLQRDSKGGVAAAGRVSGAVEAIVHLPHVYACGACHDDVLAVLHKRQAGPVGSSSSREGRESSMDVSLLRLQAGGQLQELTVTQGALGLCAPAHSPLGLLCPTKHHQLQHDAAVGDQSAIQLAAVIVLSSSSGSKQTAAWGDSAAASSLGAHAWLDPSQAAGLPWQLLGILATAPHASIPHTESAMAAAGAVNNSGTDAAGLGVQDSAELRGLQAMLSVLEGRWQQGELGMRRLGRRYCC